MTVAYVAFVDDVFTRTYSENGISKVAVEGSIPIGMLICDLNDR